MKKLSVVLATRNEEENIGRCLEAIIKMFADLPAQAGEIVIFDEYSTDKTVEIAKKYGAKVYREQHHANFHITKQKAIDKATGDWILQLDADEVVTPALSAEIKEVIEMSNKEILQRKPDDKNLTTLISRHNRIRSDIGNNSEDVVAFFIPRINFFLGKPLIHAGVYPDPAIRLIKKGRAHLPAKSVHEMMKVDGRVAWLFNDLEHYDSPTLSRYFYRLNRYTDLHADELRANKISKGVAGFLNYVVIKPVYVFVNLYIRHRGFLDGMRGFMWSALSASHFPIAYFKYVSHD